MSWLSISAPVQQNFRQLQTLRRVNDIEIQHQQIHPNQLRNLLTYGLPAGVVALGGNYLYNKFRHNFNNQSGLNKVTNITKSSEPPHINYYTSDYNKTIPMD
jgi:hypothetical protein